MKTIDLNSWDEFPNAVLEIRNEYGKRSIDIPDKEAVLLSNEILFRGQADSQWKLQTTLERATNSHFTVQQYLQRANSCVNEIESVTGKRWNLKSYPEILKEIVNTQDMMRVHLPHYEYLVYLRHHAFPSPLLDWTTSPYIAAYFACESNNDAERLAIFVFIERPDGYKTGRSGSNKIKTFGPYATTDVRHFAQKARYSVATSWDSSSKTHTFCSHDDVPPPPFGKQDILIKITIPKSDRIRVLNQLEEYNINHYTLFQSEDSLIHSMGLRAFNLNGTYEV
tara:strand:- start:33949 stop:34791 length:843 start_codon:yes stop_codon:yes gene_type:complete